MHITQYIRNFLPICEIQALNVMYSAFLHVVQSCDMFHIYREQTSKNEFKVEVFKWKQCWWCETGRKTWPKWPNPRVWRCVHTKHILCKQFVSLLFDMSIVKNIAVRSIMNDHYLWVFLRGGDKTHAFGVRDPGSNPLRDTNVSLSKTLNPYCSRGVRPLTYVAIWIKVVGLSGLLFPHPSWARHSRLLWNGTFEWQLLIQPPL